ncbi:MAG: hypothetical protein D6710_08320 [Nitrospirae bacterium]|nr:MAG: hypothetical protein D6710_08320 [Nitrospirota bacterium]
MPDIPDEILKLPEDRGEERQYFVARQESEDRKDSEWLAKLLVIAAGTNVFGRAVGRNLFADLLDYAGRFSRFASRLRGPVTSEFAPETADKLYQVLGIPRDAGGAVLRIGTGGARASDLPIMQDLAEAITAVQSPAATVDTKQLATQFRKHFNNLPRSRGGSPPSVLHHDLQPLTFGDILEHAGDWIENIGSSRFQTKTASGQTKPLTIGVVERALDLGFISKDTIVDANLFVKKEGGKILQVRNLSGARPRTILEGVSQFFDPFGLVKSAASFFKSGRTVATIAPDSETGLQRIFIGGDVFRISASKGLEKVATGQTLGVVGEARYKAATLRELSFSGKLKNVEEPLPEGASFFTRLRYKAGIGPEFAGKRGIGPPVIAQALRSIRAVAKGEAVFFGKEYKRRGGSIIDELFRAEYPEIAQKYGQDIVRGKYAGRGFLEKSEVKFFDRIKAYLGASKDLALLKREAKGKPISNLSKSDLYHPFRQAGITSLERPLASKATLESKKSITTVGAIDTIERPKLYATSAHPIDTLYDFANYMTIRLNSLASSSLLGIGFRPSGNLAVNVARLAAIPATYYGIYEGIRYADYLTEKTTGISPIETAATFYTKLRVAQQKAREALGITSAAEFVEKDLLPGVSFGFLGTAAATALGLKTLGATGSFAKAAALGGAVYAAVGGPDVSQPAQELAEEYSGERKVPIKKSRWWLLGYQPFSGTKVEYFAPSWYQRLINKPVTKNIYGSEEEYWKYHSLLPTPSNFFGLRPLLSPYRLEKKHYYDRPYPVTGGLFEEVPIVGPILSDTIGAIIKPRKQMHPAQQEGVITASQNVSERGVPKDVATRLGIPSIPGSLVDIDRPDVLADRLEKYANVALEPTGIWKFALEMFGIKFDDGVKLAEAGTMSSLGRQLFSARLGGAFGQTEFIRRFLLSDYNTEYAINNQINPIPNMMPRWLPGTLSELPRDKTYYIDFTKGDAYAKLPGGEYRLPGPGYESVNELYSGIPGVYSDVDKFLILSDVAPFSTAYYKYLARVKSLELPPKWQKRIEQAIEMREEKAQLFDFDLPTAEDEIRRANQSPLTKTIRGSWEFVSGEVLHEIPIIGSKFFPTRDPYEHYVKFQLEGDTFADWRRPIETIARPAIYDIMGEDPVTAIMKGAAIGAMMTTGVTSMFNPFTITKANPLLTIGASATAGGALSAYRIAKTGQLEGGYIPEHVEREREFKEYFDTLQYVRGRYLESVAMMQGQKDISRAFRQQATKTKAFGLEYFKQTGDTSKYVSSLDRTERAYFEAFARADLDEREKILGVVPEHMAEVLKAVYDNAIPRQKADIESVQEAVNEAVYDYFDNHRLPGPDNPIWHPQVPMNAIKLKAIEGGLFGVSENYHRLGFYEVQKREVEARFPNISVNDSSLDTRNVDHEILNSLRNGIQMDFIPVNMGLGPNVNVYRGNIYDSRRNDIAAFFTETYR